jgi:hypothetical protein
MTTQEGLKKMCELGDLGGLVRHCGRPVGVAPTSADNSGVSMSLNDKCTPAAIGSKFLGNFCGVPEALVIKGVNVNSDIVSGAVSISRIQINEIASALFDDFEWNKVGCWTFFPAVS